MNVRSINFHFEEIQVLVASFKVLPVAICLTETWGNQVDDTDSLLLNKYQKPLHISRIIKNSGVFIYFHDDYSVKEIPGGNCGKSNLQTFSRIRPIHTFMYLQRTRCGRQEIHC